MKSGKLMCITAITLFTLLAIPARFIGQDNQDHKQKHHHYKLVDMGTFGGPQSRIDYQVNINNHGIVSGSADTSVPNPYYGNDGPLFFADPFIEHTFQWKAGVLTDLGSLPGGGTSQPNWINEKGDVAGNASNSVIDPLTGWPESLAVLYKDGQVINLGTLGGNESAATGINIKDQVTGFAGNTIPDQYSMIGWGTQTRAFLWEKDTGMRDLGTLGGPDALANMVSESGQVVGASYTNSIPNPTTGIPTMDPFLWEKGKMIDLGTLGGTLGSAGLVNNRGQVDGTSNLAGDMDFHPFLWTKSEGMRDLGTLGGCCGTAGPLNNAGEVIGWATNTGDQALLGFLWKDGVMTNLGTVAGDPCSIASFINSKSQIVGVSWDCVNYLHAFLWENGSIVDLNTLVPQGSGVQLTWANGINDRGEITAFGMFPNGDNHAFLLIPCDKNQGDGEECEGDWAGTKGLAQSIPTVAQNPTTMTQDSPPLNQRVAAIRARLAHRYPYHGFGIYRPK
jgi:probable HAF family extracellular repeat protein